MKIILYVKPNWITDLCYKLQMLQIVLHFNDLIVEF